MSPKPPKAPARRRSDDVRADIITHATRLFATHGFDAVAMRDISRAARVPLSGIYRHFKDKRTLYTECEVDAFGAITNSIFENAANADTAHEAVFQLTRSLCDLHLNNTIVSKLSLRQLVEEDYESLGKLADQVISPPSIELSKRISQLSGDSGALEKVFSIFVLTWGFAMQAPLGQMLGWNLSHLQSPDEMSRFILSMIFPSENWSEALGMKSDEPARTRARTPKR